MSWIDCIMLMIVMFVMISDLESSLVSVFFLKKIVQARLVQGTSFIHETFGGYKTIEQLWDGEV